MKHEHAAWAAETQPAPPQRFHIELRTAVICLAVLQVIADVFQVLGLSV